MSTLNERQPDQSVGAPEAATPDAATPDAGAVVVPSAWAPGDLVTPALPSRYDIREGDGVRYLAGHEAPGVGVAIDRSYAYSETEARKLGERVILIDGAGQFAPLVDSGRQLYNLDHHAECLRAFTLATCEQALVLVLKGLELDKGDWRILANEPDLDTVFALWVLLNYRRLRQMGPEARDRIVPLLRLEGAIDANGFEIAAYCGLPHGELLKTKAEIDALFADEIAAKKRGAWDDAHLLEYTRGQLEAIDKLVYTEDDFDHDMSSVDQEYGHVGIGENRVAVVCRDGAGIYDVERRLKQVWQDRLGIIALAKDGPHFTLRRAAALAAIDLNVAYDRLNQYDPAVDGHPPEKRWGGSDDIGGSPRPTGTGLEPKDLVSILRLAYRPLERGQHMSRLGSAVVVALVAALGAAAGFWGYLHVAGQPTVQGDSEIAYARHLLAGGAMLVLVGVCGFGWLARSRKAWASGWRRPAATEWLLPLPAALFGGALGGAWIPRELLWDTRPLTFALAGTAVAAIGLACTFAGLVHGRLADKLPTSILRGRWFMSHPATITGILYALTTLAFAFAWIAPAPEITNFMGTTVSWVLAGLGSFMLGTSTAMIRERSLSIWPAALAFFLASVVRMLVEFL